MNAVEMLDDLKRLYDLYNLYKSYKKLKSISRRRRSHQENSTENEPCKKKAHEEDQHENCFKNKTGLLEAKECGTIYWNEYQEDFFMMSCKFCNKWFKKIEEFFKHMQIHRKTIKIDNLHKDSYIEIEFTDYGPEIHNYDDEVNNIIPSNEQTLDIAQETQNLDIEPQDNLELTWEEVTKNNQNECDTNIDDDNEDIIKEDNKICRFCGKFFATTTGKKEHERVHTGETSYSCRFCSANFRTSRARKSHSEVCMKNPNRIPKPKARTKLYECDRCHINFVNSSNLNVHKLRHDGIKKFSCSYCEKRFITTTEQRIHERSHTGSRPYLCTTCGKSFSRSSNLTEHIRKHKGEKSHKCQICGKEFYSFSMLKDHIATHSNHKPFKCEACDAAFATKKGWRAHKKLHDEVGKYLCTICNKIFKQYSGLYSHLKIHNIEKLKEHIHKTN